MKKNLYFLDEAEKRRILRLHESRTKKQYLVNEGLIDWLEYKKAPLPDYSNGITMQNTACLPSRNDYYVPYADAGWVYQKPDENTTVYYHDTGFYIVEKSDGTRTEPAEFVCNGNDIYYKTGTMAEQSQEGWDNYPCVTDTGINPEQGFVNGSTAVGYKINNQMFYETGDYVTSDNQTKKYKCVNGRIVDSETSAFLDENVSHSFPPSGEESTTSTETSTTDNTNTTTNTGGNRSGGAGGYQTYSFGSIVPNTITSKTLTDIRTKIGSTEQSGTLTQADINALYKKISGQ